METIDEMRARHGKEIQELQDQCLHPKVSGWMLWAPEHFPGEVRVCEICGKIIERRAEPLTDVHWATLTDDNKWATATA